MANRRADFGFELYVRKLAGRFKISRSIVGARKSYAGDTAEIRANVTWLRYEISANF